MDFSDWALIIIIIVGILLWNATKHYNRFVDASIPYLKPIPFIGNNLKLLLKRQSVPEWIQDTCEKFRGYRLFGIFSFDQPVFFLRDPELIKMVTVKDFEHFLDHKSFPNDDTETLFGKGLFNLKGQQWRDMRSTLSPAFTSSKMKGMFNLMDECGKQMSEFMKKCLKEPKLPSDGFKIEKDGDILVVEMKDVYTRYTNDVIATAAFGISVDSLQNPKNKFYEMGNNVTQFKGIRALTLFLLMAFPRIAKILGIKMVKDEESNFFRHLVHDTMAVREEKGIFRPDMIHLLMEAKKGTLVDESNTATNVKKPKQKWSDDDLTAQAFLFFFAGFDTASTLLCFTSYLLAVHSEMQIKLQNEIDEMLSKNDGKVTYEALHAMKYLDMVVSETLRMYPPAAATDRICTKTYTFPMNPPVQIKPGELISIPVYAFHRDPEYFPDPEKFDPERFSDENKHKIKPFTYMPFGSGPRNCIGSRFALMEGKLAIVHLLSCFNLKVVPKTPIPLKLSRKGFNMAIDEGFWIGLQLRNHSVTLNANQQRMLLYI